MTRGGAVLLACEISRSGLSGERVFRAQLDDHTAHIGVAPVDYCRTPDRMPIGPNEPVEGTRINGFIEGYVVENSGNEAKVALPDGEFVLVPIERISFVSEPQESTDVPSSGSGTVSSHS
jgi:hypothetical protein